MIGGASSGAGNLISGNGGSGVVIQNQNRVAMTNTVHGNLIGLAANGLDPLGNELNGVFVMASDNTIGGTTAGARNVISANERGIYISAATGNLVQGNYIGTDISGSLKRGNVGVGLRIEDSVSNTVRGNVIAGNGAEGIDIPGSSGNVLQGNRIGLTATLSMSNVIVIQGTLNSLPNTNFTLEFFSNGACDASGYGEGEGFLGSVLVATDASGNAPFDTAFASSSLIGLFASATATDPSGNTSELSRCVQVAPLKVYLPLIER